MTANSQKDIQHIKTIGHIGIGTIACAQMATPTDD